MKKRIKNNLDRKKKSKEYSRVKRVFDSNLSPDYENGIIYDFSNKLVQIQSIEDFKFHQTVIFLTKQIKKIRFNKNDKYYDKILSCENIKKSLTQYSAPNLKNWKKLFETVKLECIIVETEMSKNRIFHIGGILKIKKKGIVFINFNARGKLDKKPYLLHYNEITKVILDSNYADVFNRYVKVNAM